ncbi:hypothetical protein FRC06_010638 [Ceratobasidium sp. 370]|nr:hypothetical protein FRC06_010638 [Ceratobasidium sp. 370]
MTAGGASASTSRKSTGGKAPRVKLPTPLDSDDEASPAGGRAGDQPKPPNEPRSPADSGAVPPLEGADQEE